LKKFLDRKFFLFNRSIERFVNIQLEMVSNVLFNLQITISIG
jgi:hypothetical protein